MIKILFTRLVWSLKILTAYLDLPVRLVQWTGKSPHPVHPKHLLGDAAQAWYLERLSPGDRVLDIGCANGMHTLACAARCRAVYGFDASPAHLRVARALAAERGVANALFYRGDAEQPYPFQAGTFQMVVFLDVLEHLVQRDAALAEVRRVLAPGGGVLALAVPNRETSWKRLRREAGLFPYADPDHKIEYSLPEIQAELGRHGFVCEQVLPIVYDTPWEWAVHIAGGLSLALYRRLQDWRREQATRRPQESTGFRIVARLVGEAARRESAV